jgi:aminoglycoside phosphotransferase (APT) family kinase protein
MADTLDDGPVYEQPETVSAGPGEELDAAVVADDLRPRLPRTCTLGDPLADLGQLVCYWPEAGDPPARVAAFPSPTMLPGFLTRAEVVQHYAERSGTDVSHIAFYEAYGLWRTATVVAQLFMLYQQGQSKDERLRAYDRRMQAFAEAAQDVIQHAYL